jgi:hypothetical protein
MKWNGYNTLQVLVTCPNDVSYIYAVFTDVTNVPRTADLLLHTSNPLTYAATLAFAMRKDQYVDIYVKFNGNSSQSVYTFPNNQQDVDFM